MAEAENRKKCNRCGTEYPDDLEHFRPQYHTGEPPRPSGVCRQCHKREKNDRYHGRKTEGRTSEKTGQRAVSVVSTIPVVSMIPTIPVVSVIPPGPTVAMSLRLPRSAHEKLRAYAFDNRISMNMAVVKLITEAGGPDQVEREDIEPQE